MMLVARIRLDTRDVDIVELLYWEAVAE